MELPEWAISAIAIFIASAIAAFADEMRKIWLFKRSLRVAKYEAAARNAKPAKRPGDTPGNLLGD